MKLSKKLIFTLCLLFSLSFVFTGCKSSNLTKIKLAEVTHSIFYAPQYVAISEGFFEEEGLDVELINTQGADKTMAALLSGEVDIGFMGPEASIYVYNQGREDYAINFAQLTQRDGSFLVGREKDDNFSFDKLKGKTIIGGRKGGMPLMTLEYVLKNKGLEIGKDVIVRTDIQFAAMAGAFVGGEGDYVTLFEPTASALEKQSNGYIVASIGKESGYIPYTCYSATKSYIEKNPDIIQRFTNAIYKAQLWVNSNSPEAIANSISNFFPEIDLESLTEVVKRYKHQDTWSKTPILEKESLEHLMDIMQLAGELDKRAPYEKIVTTEFAKNSVENIK
ncbi:NitT/TauT family transport system substrate-binding protein [Alkalithermobacter thermoalcaliphilus JW-YL-7 = DSM 7308]|uniref:ABC transporter substrate-binding protein n=1 Tax=Alkalithermobacter thermoalcaliphilus JW-YL-7 = DSM 7308 TaxID=1121328 RepID=A0A150FRU2_CLOPD|nr:ABC transporter substrate-binding protein [[Clostridium] paradoxum JW-YL-7 = DSM 7308]SHK38581.1 NitT/TauT family transport system substrate-binding protein [[Clostridium] paradoxum JW-YL-7 = DSM 7308]